jgi:DNA-directed RNA polymerase specialized sigma24 family protein
MRPRTKRQRIIAILRENPEAKNHVIMRKVECHATTVARCRRALGIQRKYSQAYHDEFLALYRQGLRDTQVARKTGWSATTVKNWRQAHNLPVKPDSLAEQRRRAVELVLIGKASYAKAAEATGLSRGVVAGAVSRARAA